MFSELEPAEKNNLVFIQDGKAALLQQIQSFGITGEEKKNVIAPVSEVVEATSTPSDSDLFSFN